MITVFINMTLALQRVTDVIYLAVIAGGNLESEYAKLLFMLTH